MILVFDSSVAAVMHKVQEYAVSIVVGMVWLKSVWSFVYIRVPYLTHFLLNMERVLASRQGRGPLSTDLLPQLSSHVTRHNGLGKVLGTNNLRYQSNCNTPTTSYSARENLPNTVVQRPCIVQSKHSCQKALYRLPETSNNNGRRR
jgi:hypothetical protein